MSKTINARLNTVMQEVVGSNNLATGESVKNILIRKLAMVRFLSSCYGENTRWIPVLHKDATTSLVLPNGLSRTITVLFNFKQGYPADLVRFNEVMKKFENMSGWMGQSSQKEEV